jgi:hypothetical protein
MNKRTNSNNILALVEKPKQKKHRKPRVQLEDSVKLPVHVALLKVHTCITMIALALKNAVGGCDDTETCSKFRDLKIKSPAQHSTISSMLRNVTRKVFGTFMPKLPFRSYDPAVIASTSGVVTLVVTLETSVLAGFGYWGTIFDEYHPTGPFTITYFPTFSAGPALVAGVIDYVDSTALSSKSAAMIYDTVKVFSASFTGGNEQRIHWNGHLSGIPDMTWLDTSNTGQDFAYWKSFAFAATSGSQTYGYLWFEDVWIEFRQQAGA